MRFFVRIFYFDVDEESYFCDSFQIKSDYFFLFCSDPDACLTISLFDIFKIQVYLNSDSEECIFKFINS